MSPVAVMAMANRSERCSCSYQTSKCLLSAVLSLTRNDRCVYDVYSVWIIWAFDEMTINRELS